MAEPFIYTNPAAGQQAVQYAQLQAQQEMDRDRQVNDLYKTMSDQATRLGLGSQQASISRNQMSQRAAEAEKDRELARQGYTNAQTVAGITAGPRADALNARKLADDAANKQFALDNFNRGTSFATTLNDPKTPLSLKQKLMQSGDVEMGPDGLWRSRHRNPSENINDILARRAGLGQSTISAVPVPSPGGFTPRETDFRVPVLYPGGPTTEGGIDNVAPPYIREQSPFETPGFKVFRQSDFTNPPAEVPTDQPWMQSGY